MKERQCQRCNEFWPDDEEFYKGSSKNCIACNYEVRRAQKQRRKERDAALPEQQRLAKLEANRAANRERERARREARKSMV